LDGRLIYGEFSGLGERVGEGEFEEMGGGFEGEEVWSNEGRRRRRSARACKEVRAEVRAYR